MRVLFTTYPEKSFFLAMVPLAWALRTAGHDVRFASQPELTDVITQAGLTAVPVGRNNGLWRLAEQRPDEVQAARVGFPEPYDVAELRTEDIKWEYLRANYDFAVKWWHKMENVPMVSDLVAFARFWQPDLVIWEPTSFAGAIAAKATGAAHARLMWGLDVFGVTREHYLRLKALQPRGERADPLADWLGQQARRFGAEYTEDMTSGHFTIDQLPDSFRMTADLHYVPMQFVPYGGAAVVPDWLRTPPTRPRVALTLGIAATGRFDGYLVGVQDVLDSLADLDIEIVATLSENEQKKLKRVPGNARIVSYVPLQALVPTCSAVIHHAGFGTMSTTTLHAVPQLALPVHWDEPQLAQGLEREGAGLALPSNGATGQAVREHLLRLLNEPSFREGAARLRDKMLAMPTPSQLVPQLEELTTKYSSRGC